MPHDHPHTALIAAHSTVTSGSTTTHAALNELIRTIGSLEDTTDPELCGYITDIESLARQVHMHGDPDLDGYTVAGILDTAATHAAAYQSDDETGDELHSHVTELREDILEARPETTVIEDYNLEEPFSNAVRQAFNE